MKPTMTLPLTAASTAGQIPLPAVGVISSRSSGFRAGCAQQHKTVVPAKAGIHRSAFRTTEEWVPAFAGKPIFGKPERACLGGEVRGRIKPVKLPLGRF